MTYLMFIKTELSAGKDTAFARYMKDALDSLDLNNKDIMGDVYEYLLSQIAQSGTNGQFRTPRHIIKMMVELMQPQMEDVICDPAMGSAGFICAAAQFITEHYSMELMQTANKRHFMAYKKIGAFDCIIYVHSAFVLKLIWEKVWRLSEYFS